ncbi:MAG: M23 family metallopeptidase [Muribaculaceae bacterium]|nr:M23 family metallopeptidase [Muribaculaceae bacterium]
MGRNIFYRYNPETDNFERVFPTWKTRLRSVLIYLAGSLTFGILLFFIVNYYYESPTEETLRKQNAELRSRYNILNHRLDNSLKVMEDIRMRDDNFYRVLLRMEPMLKTRRLAGLDNSRRYSNLKDISDDGLVTLLSQRLDLFERQLYTQSQSFDELKAAAESEDDRMEHIPSIFPVGMKKLSILSGFGPRRNTVTGEDVFHEGIDLAARAGTSVLATADGTVLLAERQSGYGKCIEIDHGYNYVTRYTHLNDILVEEGSRVKRGDLIGRVGTTGKSLGPHLHYEVRFKNQPENPVNYFFHDLTPEQYNLMLEEADNAGMMMD